MKVDKGKGIVSEDRYKKIPNVNIIYYTKVDKGGRGSERLIHKG